MSIGQLRHRLSPQAPTATADSYGGRTIVWTDVVTLWGRIDSLRGAEQLHGMQLGERVTHRITIRFREDVSAVQRLRFGSRIFKIQSVLDRDGRRRWLELLCEEEVAP